MLSEKLYYSKLEDNEKNHKINWGCTVYSPTWQKIWIFLVKKADFQQCGCACFLLWFVYWNTKSQRTMLPGTEVFLWMLCRSIPGVYDSMHLCWWHFRSVFFFLYWHRQSLRQRQACLFNWWSNTAKCGIDMPANRVLFTLSISKSWKGQTRISCITSRGR